MINSRRKGKAGELEASHYLTSLFNLPVRRGQQYQGGHDSADIFGLPGLHIEVKRTERLSVYDAMRQAQEDAGADEVPLVLHRRNRKEWLAIVPADDLINLTTAIVRLARDGQRDKRIG